MADVFFGVNVGATGGGAVTTSSSSLSKDVELVVDDAKIARAGVAAKNDLLAAIDALRDFVKGFDY